MLTAAVSAAAPIHALAVDLRARYGRSLRRVTLDLGLSCPNRDGRSGYGGCVYCDAAGSGTGAAASLPLAEQWRRGLDRLRRKCPDGPAAIAYFQSYSNTYPALAPVTQALHYLAAFRDAAPIVSVGTRPDCFSADAADLLASFTGRFDEVWVEFGLETADDAVQARIQRYDTLASFHAACALARARGLRIVCHCIAGLPGERPGGLIRQVEEAATAGVDGIKFHQLMVLRRTKLEAWWRRGALALLTAERYVEMVADALEWLPERIAVHRLVADAPPAEYLAPRPGPPRLALHQEIVKELQRRGTRQGWFAAAR